MGLTFFPGARPGPSNTHGCTDLDIPPARLLTPPAPTSTDKSHHHSLLQALTPQLKLPGLVLPGRIFSLHFHGIPFNLSTEEKLLAFKPISPHPATDCHHLHQLPGHTEASERWSCLNPTGHFFSLRSSADHSVPVLSH